jgi:hypothetical protein
MVLSSIVSNAEHLDSYDGFHQGLRTLRIDLDEIGIPGPIIPWTNLRATILDLSCPFGPFMYFDPWVSSVFTKLMQKDCDGSYTPLDDDILGEQWKGGNRCGSDDP